MDRGYAGVVRELLDDPRVDAATGEDTPLVIASSRGRCEIVGLLLRAEGVDPARHESLALCVAARYGRSAVVRELLRDGRVVPSARESAALRWACNGGHAETVGELLKEGSSDPLGGGCSCLNIACGRGHCAVLAKLLGHFSGGHLERLGDVQEALRIACAHESVDVIELLLATGRVVDVADNNNAALELATRLERHALATRLLRDPRVDEVGLRDCPLAQLFWHASSSSGSAACEPGPCGAATSARERGALASSWPSRYSRSRTRTSSSSSARSAT